MDFTLMVAQLGEGMVITAEIFFLTLLFSLPLGLVISFGRMSRNFLLRTLTKIYISVMRGTPLMLQLIVVYFSPYYVFGIKISPSYRFTAVILAFALNYAAYFAEIYRGGIESMPVGQYEAAQVLGYSKDTSLAFVLAVVEMFTAAKQIAAKETTILPLMAAGVFYYIFNLAVATFMEYLEKRMSYYR